MIIKQNDLAKFTIEERKCSVLCFGCFDILHIGHILYFEKLKRLNPVVFVGLFNDASVSASKGLHRPILLEHERLTILDALKNVNYVFVQEPGNVNELIKKYKVETNEIFIWENCIYPISLLKPEVVAISTDFKLTEKMKLFCTDNNINLTVVDYCDQNSTSKIIEKIKNSTRP